MKNNIIIISRIFPAFFAFEKKFMPQNCIRSKSGSVHHDEKISLVLNYIFPKTLDYYLTRHVSQCQDWPRTIGMLFTYLSNGIEHLHGNGHVSPEFCCLKTRGGYSHEGNSLTEEYIFSLLEQLTYVLLYIFFYEDTFRMTLWLCRHCHVIGTCGILISGKFSYRFRNTIFEKSSFYQFIGNHIWKVWLLRVQRLFKLEIKRNLIKRAPR